MTITRRELLMAALGAGTTAFLAGCQVAPQPRAEAVNNRPGPWDDRRKVAVGVRPPAPGPGAKPVHVEPQQKQVAQVASHGEPPATLNIAGLNILPRAAWTSALGPVYGGTPPMNGVKHITVHHDGIVVNFEDKANTIELLEKIRHAHTTAPPKGEKPWADIGYHFIIDRAGRIWEGRNVALQGAHVSQCNPHNLGVMCLGNFDVQSPSQAQMDSLITALKAFKAHYQVPMGEIFTHQEWKKRCPSTATECPGRSLQAQMGRIRTKEVIG